MNNLMKNLLEKLNLLTSEKRLIQTTARDKIFSKIRWWGNGIAGSLLVIMALVGLTFPPSPFRNLTIDFVGILAMLMPIIVLVSSILESSVFILQWRKESFTSLISESDFDHQRALTLISYSEIELERAKLWLKAKIEKDTWRLSMFGTDKISFLTIFGFLSTGWTILEKSPTTPMLRDIQTVIFYVLAFIGGTIIGSVLLRIGHQRFQKMLIWIDLALFEKKNVSGEKDETY